MSIERLQNQQVEIERKFLVDLAKFDASPDDFEHTFIRQGYLVLGKDGSEARVRDKNGKLTLTVKSKGDLVRGEWEIPLSEEQFDILWLASEGKRVEKTRFEIPHGKHTIELDIYEGQLEGLVVAEVEFGSEPEAESFDLPEWLTTDISNNKAYKNQTLAEIGLENE